MNKIRILVLKMGLVFFVYSCSSNVKEYRCGLNPKSFPKHGSDSKILEFTPIGIMDTITVVVHGKLIELKNAEALASGNIQLRNKLKEFNAVSDSLGNFKFYHIPSGNYELIANYVGFRQLLKDSILLKSGEITHLKIGMGNIGQDDFYTK